MHFERPTLLPIRARVCSAAAREEFSLHQVRERHLTDAVQTARPLAGGFPANRELATFLTTHDLHSSR
jgi:hypothetical protein